MDPFGLRAISCPLSCQEVYKAAHSALDIWGERVPLTSPDCIHRPTSCRHCAHSGGSFAWEAVPPYRRRIFPWSGPRACTGRIFAPAVLSILYSFSWNIREPAQKMYIVPPYFFFLLGFGIYVFDGLFIWFDKMVFYFPCIFLSNGGGKLYTLHPLLCNWTMKYTMKEALRIFFRALKWDY